jgi:hypothetical protein
MVLTNYTKEMHETWKCKWQNKKAPRRCLYQVLSCVRTMYIHSNRGVPSHQLCLFLASQKKCTESSYTYTLILWNSPSLFVIRARAYFQRDEREWNARSRLGLWCVFNSYVEAHSRAHQERHGATPWTNISRHWFGTGTVRCGTNMEVYPL